MLRVISLTMVEVADEQGHVPTFVRKRISASGRRPWSLTANDRVYAMIYFSAALEQLVLDARYSGEGNDSGDFSSRPQ